MIKQKTLKVLDSVVDNVKPYSKDAAFHIEQAISIIEKFKGQQYEIKRCISKNV